MLEEDSVKWDKNNYHKETSFGIQYKKGLLTPAKRAIAAPPGEWEYNSGSGRSEVFSYPSRIRRPRSLCCRWNFRMPFRVRKLESWGYSVVKIA